MSLFGKARDTYRLQKQAKTIKKELKNIHIESESDGVKVVCTAEQELLSASVLETTWNELRGSEHGKAKLEAGFLKAANKGLKKAQEIASAKMKDLWGEIGAGA